MINGRTALFLFVVGIVVGGGSYLLYYLLLPKFRKWYSGFDNKYERYEKRNK